MAILAEDRVAAKDLTVGPPREAVPSKSVRQDERIFALSLLKHPGESVLDVGTGDCACIASFLASQGTPVVAIDKDGSVVRAARTFLHTRYGQQDVRLLHDDIFASRLPSGSFRNIVCFNVLHHISHFDRALAELHRILSSDGLLVISEFDENRDGFLERLERRVNHYFRTVAPYHRGRGRLVLSCDK